MKRNIFLENVIENNSELRLYQMFYFYIETIIDGGNVQEFKWIKEGIDNFNVALQYLQEHKEKDQSNLS